MSRAVDGHKGLGRQAPGSRHPRGLYNDKGDDHNPLTPEGFYRLLRRLHAELTDAGDMEPPADFLLLLYALAHEDDHRKRWWIYSDAREMFAIHVSPQVDNAVGDALAEALRRVKASEPTTTGKGGE